MRAGVVGAAIAAVVTAILVAGAGDQGGPNAFVVIGIGAGASYGLVALGIVLVYKGTRVFNFAQGEFGTIAAFILYVLIEQVKSPEIPYLVAAVLAIAGAVLIGLAMERLVIRPLLNAPRITMLVATISFALLSVGMQIMLFLPEPKNLTPLIPTIDASGAPNGPEIFGYFVEPQRLLLIGVLIALAGMLGWFFSRTDLGLAVLATSQDEFATRVVGIGVERMSRFIWVSAAFLGALAGVLYVPLSGSLTPGVMTTGVLIPAFTGAVIGGMTSLPGAFVGGTVVGIVQSLANWAANHYSLGGTRLQDIVPGFADFALFSVLLLVLLVRPQGLLGREA
jgi:branched-chain amino acid transport system permease protein